MIQTFRLTTPYACGAVIFRNGIAISSAPIYGWMVRDRFSIAKLRNYVKYKKWELEELSDATPKEI